MEFLGIDVGASKIEYAYAERAKSVKTSECGRIEIDAGIDTTTLLHIIGVLAQTSDPAAIGLSVPGFVVKGQMIRLPNLQRVDGRAFMRGLKAATRGRPIIVENDAKCMALAEWTARGRDEEDDFLLVAAGSGIGGAIVRDGRLARGAHNLAGEFGHMRMAGRPAGERTGADNVGCRPEEWEAQAGGFGIARRWRRANPDHRRLSAKEIFYLSYTDADARKIVNQSARSFASGLAELACILDPKEIIVAGSLGCAYLKDAQTRKLVLQTFRQDAREGTAKTPIRLSRSPHRAREGACLLAGMEEDREIKKFLA